MVRLDVGRLLRIACGCQLKLIPLLGSITPANTSAVVPVTAGAPILPFPSYSSIEDESDVPYSSPNDIVKS